MRTPRLHSGGGRVLGGRAAVCADLDYPGVESILKSTQHTPHECDAMDWSAGVSSRMRPGFYLFGCLWCLD